MTLLVGVLATDGAVIAADRAITFGSAKLPTISDRMVKVTCVADDMIVAGTGAVGMGQRFAQLVGEFEGHRRGFKLAAPSTPPKNPTEEQRKNEAQSTQIDVLRANLRALQAQLQHISPARQIAEQFVHQGRTKDPTHLGAALSQLMTQELGRTNADRGQFGALAAYVTDGKPRLCEFSVGDFQPEQKDAGCWYTSMGSGQILADPYLAFMRRTFWRGGQPNVGEAIFTALWVIFHAIEAAPAFIAHPIDIAVLKKWDGDKYTARLLDENDRSEHENSVKAADEHLIAFRRPPKDLPDVPALPGGQQSSAESDALGVEFRTQVAK